MWWKFKRHRIAVWCGWFLLALYLIAVFAEFLAPYNLDSRHIKRIYHPPQAIHLFHEGSLVGPFVYDTTYKLNMVTLKREYTIDRSKPLPLRFFCKGEPYEMWGFIPLERRLFCAPEGETAFLLGTDRLGRDMLSRIIYGARISLSIGLIGVSISFLLGIIIGGLAGYYGGWIDMVVQRIIEVIQSIPSIPLWLALAAIMPVTWNPLLVYFAITVILGLLDWTGLARAVRSKLLALREEDYVLAAQLMGASPRRIIARHLIPGFISHLIATATDLDSHDDPWRNRAELPGPGPAPSGHVLGRAADRSAEHQRRGVVPVADAAGGSGDPRHSRLQLPGRWTARCRRPLQVIGKRGDTTIKTALPARILANAE